MMRSIIRKYILAFSILTNALLTLALCVLVHKAGYEQKILVRLGLAEPVRQTDWSAFSWESCLRNLNMDVDVVFLGDSITRGGNFQHYFTDVSICNLGLSGDTINRMQNRLGMIDAVRPEKLFLMVGVNHLNNFQGELTSIVSKYEQLLDRIETEYPHITIYIESLLPVNESRLKMNISNKDIAELNILLKQMAARRGLEYIDLHTLYAIDGSMPSELTKDGIHLHPHAYARWANAIRDFIKS